MRPTDHSPLPLTPPLPATPHAPSSLHYVYLAFPQFFAQLLYMEINTHFKCCCCCCCCCSCRCWFLMKYFFIMCILLMCVGVCVHSPIACLLYAISFHFLLLLLHFVFLYSPCISLNFYFSCCLYVFSCKCLAVWVCQCVCTSVPVCVSLRTLH